MYLWGGPEIESKAQQYMAVCKNWGVLFVGVLLLRALLFGGPYYVFPQTVKL